MLLVVPIRWLYLQPWERGWLYLLRRHLISLRRLRKNILNNIKRGKQGELSSSLTERLIARLGYEIQLSQTAQGPLKIDCNLPS